MTFCSRLFYESSEKNSLTRLATTLQQYQSPLLILGQFFSADCGGDVPHYNPGIGGTYYVPGYKITNPTSFADGLFVPINTRSELFRYSRIHI